MKSTAPTREVHRQLDRHDSGTDVTQLQHGENRTAEHYKLPFLKVSADSQVGPRTEHSASLLLFAMGVYGDPIKRVRAHHEISEQAQRLLRGSARRNPKMVALSVKRRREVKKWRKAHEDSSSVTEKSALTDLLALIAKHMPYVFGGGHVTPANSGPGDCSWLASRLRQHWESKSPTGTTFTLAEEALPGTGAEITLMIKNIAGQPDESHVIELWFMDPALVKQHRLQQWVLEQADVPVQIPVGALALVSECGGSDNPTPGNGPSFVIPGKEMGMSVSARLAEFSIHRHPVRG